MTKLIYPEEGLYRYCVSNVKDVEKNLNNAINRIISLPDDSKYLNCLKSLDIELTEYLNSMKNIEESLKLISRNYSDLEKELSFNHKKLSCITIKDRDRLIV